MLEARNIFFRYSKSSSWIINNLSFKTGSDEIIGLMGKSGCGKTTLSKILSGYLNVHRGEVLFNNQPLPVNGYCPVQLISQHPENAVNPRWKVKKILSEVKDIKPDNEILEALNLSTEFLERYPHELSGGELQRVNLCRILNSGTKFIIADEISGMLDTITQANIWNLVLSYASLNKIGILIISHDKSLLKKLCSNIIEDLF